MIYRERWYILKKLQMLVLLMIKFWCVKYFDGLSISQISEGLLKFYCFSENYFTLNPLITEINRNLLCVSDSSCHALIWLH